MTDLALPSGYAALFWGVITFSLLVVVHEGGHFLAARFFKVKVHEFMIGLPGPNVGWRSEKTGIRYGLTALPIGGYVRIAGMEPGAEDESLAGALAYAAGAGRVDESSLSAHLGLTRDRAAALLATLADWGAIELEGDEYVPVKGLVAEGTPDEMLARVRETTYRGLKTWQRIVVLSMGVLLNLLTAILIFTVVLSVWGVDVPSRDIGSVQKGSAAARAGLKIGDRITAIDGKKVSTWNDVPTTLGKLGPKATVELTVLRQGKTLTINAVTGSKDGHAFLGVGPGIEKQRYSLWSALVESFKFTGAVFVAIAAFFNPSTFAASVKDARSVVGISYEVARAAEAGPIDYAFMIALLSLSLGALNILPLPPLDGGKVAVELIERIRRRPLRRELSYALSAVGAVLLFSLIFYLMYADVVRYIIKG